MSKHATKTDGIFDNPYLGANGWHQRRIAYLSELIAECHDDPEYLEHLQSEKQKELKAWA